MTKEDWERMKAYVEGMIQANKQLIMEKLPTIPPPEIPCPNCNGTGKIILDLTRGTPQEKKCD